MRQLQYLISIFILLATLALISAMSRPSALDYPCPLRGCNEGFGSKRALTLHQNSGGCVSFHNTGDAALVRPRKRVRREQPSAHASPEAEAPPINVRPPNSTAIHVYLLD
jgi:hypothetical protein